ncbi:nuclease EXOG, mitochondrial-like [Mytilus californianus]|uniref:nuclease EXOG, mitochondrial-like n=1 Tax=Mytilus californianus TaxID=6549 RepID=UPI0022466894|nr:nuclease EXOG, mitochondrial-like [Mytilus californianus]
MSQFMKGIITGTFTTLAAIGSYRILFENDNQENLSSQTKASETILKYGIPDRGPDIRVYDNHILSYDQAKKTPVWVAEYITKGNIDGPADRRKIKFKSDPNVQSQFSAENSDYLGSGWSRGHMAPAGDNKHSQEAMKQSFYLSNILPQNLENNGGFWNRLEMYCRDLTKKYKGVRIFSGPLVLPTTDENGLHYVKYPVIGKNEVSVPTHLYKVIIIENDKSEPLGLGAFIVPNQPIGYEHHLKDFQVDLKQLEKCSGITFTPKLDTVKIPDMCQIDSCDLMKRDKFELYMIGRKLQGARSLKYLERVWSEIETKNLTPDNYLINLYNSRKLELTYEEKVVRNKG